jgi:hypothetical protein
MEISKLAPETAVECTNGTPEPFIADWRPKVAA